MSATDKDLFNQAVGVLDQGFTKDELSLLYLMGKKCLEKDPSLAFYLNQATLVKIESKKPLSKIDILQLCALCFFREENYRQFLQLLEPDVRKVWELLVLNSFLDQHSIEKETNVQIYRMEEVQYYRGGATIKKNVLSPKFRLFKLGNSSNRYHSIYESGAITLFLPLELRKILVRYYRKDRQLLKPMADAPAAEYVYDRSEQAFQQEYIRLMTYFQQGLLAMTGKNRPTIPSINKMQRTLGMKEFFPDTADKKWGVLRSSLLGHLLPDLAIAYKSHQETAQLLNHFFTKSYLKTRTLPATLPHLKGMGYVDDYSIQPLEEEMWGLFQALPSNAWVSAADIIDYFKYNAIDFKPLTYWIAGDKLYYEGAFDQATSAGRSIAYSEKRFIKESYYRQAIAKPYMMGSLFLFAALGICDIAYNKPGDGNLGADYFSYWDGLQAVRRTALGDYVCGHTKDWNASDIQIPSAFRLSDDTLIIYTDEPEGAKVLLEPYATKAGATTFKTDSQLFLKNVRSKKELESKIILFKQLVQTKLPSIWEEFFLELQQKINPFESPGEVYVYKIPENNQTLIKLFAQDTVLKQLVLKAEGYHLIVPKAQHAAFHNRLKEFGYLLV